MDTSPIYQPVRRKRRYTPTLISCVKSQATGNGEGFQRAMDQIAALPDEGFRRVQAAQQGTDGTANR